MWQFYLGTVVLANVIALMWIVSQLEVNGENVTIDKTVTGLKTFLIAVTMIYAGMSYGMAPSVIELSINSSNTTAKQAVTGGFLSFYNTSMWIYIIFIALLTIMLISFIFTTMNDEVNT